MPKPTKKTNLIRTGWRETSRAKKIVDIDSESEVFDVAHPKTITLFIQRESELGSFLGLEERLTFNTTMDS